MSCKEFELKASQSAVVLKGSSYTELGQKPCLIKFISETGGWKDFSASRRRTRLADTFCTSFKGDPGANRGGNRKSKRAKKNGDEERHSRAKRAPGDMFLPDQFQKVGIIRNSDWCQKFFMIFCPIRGHQAVKSFRGFLHGNHLIAILTWFVWQGVARGEKSQSQHEMYRVGFVISAEKYAGPFGGIVTVAYFQVCEICLKMSSPIHLTKQ